MTDTKGMAGDYDAGLMNDYGGGNVDWWWDYMRAEIGGCNDYHKDLALEQAADLIHEREAHAETQAALRAFIADLDRANAALILAKEALEQADADLNAMGFSSREVARPLITLARKAINKLAEGAKP